jgi:hypothetical protein
MSDFDGYSGKVASVDGLPVVQPTRSRVDEALTYTSLDPDHVLGEVAPANNRATVEKVAVNSVLAGCKPEYLPIVLGAVEAMTRDEFNLEGILTTTHPAWPVVMVNGPMARDLEINYGQNTLGQGFRANATIGRALTNVCMNIGSAVPGQMDNATHGGPHKFGLCFAENEAKNPWDPYHVEQGYDPDETTVSVFGLECLYNVNAHLSRDAGALLTTIAKTIATLGTNLMHMSEDGEPHVCMAPEHAELIAEDGWSKLDVKRFIYDQARLPKYLVEDHGSTSEAWATHFNTDDPNALIGMCSSPEDVQITVAGGPGRHSVFFPTFGDTESQTVPLDPLV